jgi:hypothetical protein
LVSDHGNEEKRLKIECKIASALLKNAVTGAAVQTVHNNESERADVIPSVYEEIHTGTCEEIHAGTGNEVFSVSVVKGLV